MTSTGMVRRPWSIAVSLALPGALLGVAAHAGDWSTSASSGLNLNFTDNVNLAPAGSAQDEIITELNARIDVERSGGIIQGGVQFAAQAQQFANQSSQARQFYQLDANANGRFIDDRLLVEARLTHSQQIIDNSVASSATNNLTVTNNTTDVTSLQLSPSYRQRIGSFASLNADATLTSVSSGVGGTGGDTRQLGIDLVSGRRFKTLSWSLAIDQSDDSQADTTSQSLQAGVGLRLRRTLSLTMDLRSSTESVAGATTNNNGGDLNLGLRWQPRSTRQVSFSLGNGGIFNTTANWAISRRQSLVFSLGNQDVARDYSLEWQLRSRRGSASLSYSEARQSIQSLTPGRLIFDDSGNILLGITLPSLTSASFIQTQYQAQTSISRGRSTYSATLTRSEREFPTGKDSINAFSLSWNWQRSARQSHQLSLSYTEQDLNGGTTPSQDQLMNLSYAMNYRVKDNLSATLQAGHNVRKSSNATTEFEANTLAVGVNANF